MTHGNRDEALKEFRSAVDLDPLSPAIRTTIPDWFYVSGDYDRAIAESRRTIEAFPEFPHARTVLIVALLLKDQYSEALEEVDKMRALTPENPLAALEFRGYALARLGESSKAEEVIAQLREQAPQYKLADGSIGVVYLGLRDYEKALDAFEQLEAKEGMDDEWLCDPIFAQVRNHPRAQALLRKAGIVPEPVHSTSDSNLSASQRKG
jgi:tetratricopeptide (TPR) repeat protein